MKIKLNPDKKIVETVKKGLKERGGYCPCRLQKNEDTKCMCKEFRDMEEGTCHCGLYIKTKAKKENN